MSRPFRFGFSLDGLDGPDEIAARVRRAEDMGYSAVVMTDHFDDRHGPLVAMTAVALATTSLRVGTMVLANDYRHPAVLAKELASLDQVSGGRLEIGIGAGWMASDYEQAGLQFDRPGVRIERLDEARCWRAASARASSTTRVRRTRSPSPCRSPAPRC